MHYMYHSNINTTVEFLSDDRLKAQCTILSTDQELVGWIITDIKDLNILQAAWEVYRSPVYTAGYYELPEVVGINAFLQSGPQLKKSLSVPDQQLTRELISECIKGVIQAETFFYKERGFRSQEDYEAFWNQVYVDSCLCFSNLDKNEGSWFEYVGDAPRSHNLFNRSHIVDIYRIEDSFSIMGTFIDSFHELNIQIRIDTEGKVIAAEAEYTRAPERICYTNSRHMEKLIGCRIQEFNKKDLILIAGGAEGCSHLADIIYAAGKASRVVLAK
ncbi:hypothetical protein ASZ90_018751 [hydrocarbon metagenome]|uniref:DUF2889 domain-containing protein n=1 Tax=hydrocarbon metagenome TaxID=938273 RepID=A0A0W8E5C2_9ZZZZ